MQHYDAHNDPLFQSIYTDCGFFKLSDNFHLKWEQNEEEKEREATNDSSPS